MDGINFSGKCSMLSEDFPCEKLSALSDFLVLVLRCSLLFLELVITSFSIR